MRLDLRPSKISELVPFQACSLRTLDSCEFASARSAVSKDGTLTWVYKGSVLEVVSTSTGQRVACLNVEHWLRDAVANIVCVREFHCQGCTRLLVAVNRSTEQGMVVLLDVPTSLVVRVIETPQQVTVVEQVLTYGGRNVPTWAFSEQLRQFCGIVAVGTEGGYVYLVDMSLDSASSVDTSQKVIPSPLLLLEPRETDIDAMRQQAAQMGQHLALRLGGDEQMNSNDCFHFRRPDLSVVQSFNEDEVYVSSLRYMPQSGTLAIGYSFGGFHLWKLFNPVLEYTSLVEPEDLPVAFFVYQEPENDPKNFAYFWVCRDDHISEQKQESLCSVSLYQLSYACRTFYANYGYFYEELNAVALRMDHNLTVDPFNSRNTTTWSSQLLSAVTIADPNYHPPTSLTINDSFEEGCQGPDLSLCAFVWEAQDSRPGGSTEVFLSIFDMNRWYHAQMPARIKCVNVGGQEVCPYFAVYRMNDAVHREGLGTLLDVRLKPGSLLRFVNNSPMPPEQHFYPSSLAFDAVCVLSNGIVPVSVLGVQRQVLASLESSGPACLLKPFDLYHRCIQTGLMARSPDTLSASQTAEEQQRMALLTLALEQGKVRFITACVRSWADGEFYQQGCTLQFLLAWAWTRVTAIKQQIDLTCQPLFDWCGAPVDQRMLQALQNCLCCLGHLKTVLHVLLNQSTPLTDQGQVELEHRIKVVTLLHYHLKVILWFVHNGLLPEHGELGESVPSNYIYPATELTQVFKDRRQQMMQLQSDVETHEMILIDALVHSAGDTVSQLWKDEDGSGMYPPPSLHAALSTYLLDGTGENTKNAIILYLLFDMAAVAHGQQEQFAEKIPLFAKTFDLPLGLVQQIHGFWLIDHMNFQEGLTQLLRHSSCQDLVPWQHTCILRALLHQGELAAASRYLSMRNPPIRAAEDLKMRLTILVANRLVWQAVAHVRHSCGSVDQEDMLRHVFLQCQQRKLMELLFKLPLTDQEEQCLQNYLAENADSTSAELLVLHLLQRAQYVPAIRLNDRMKHRATMDMSARARDRAKTRNAVVDGFRHALPATQQYLINHPPAVSKVSATRNIEVPRPKPLSTVINQRLERRANSQSALILAVMDKVAEAGKLLAEEDGEEEGRMEEEEGKQSLLTKRRDFPESDATVINKPGPFLCTPTTPKMRSRLSLASQVVYPAVKETTLAFLSTTAAASPLSPTTNTTIRRSRVFTADCMSLLQTPKIDHTPARIASPVHQTTTPHSILKVSRLPRTSPRSKGASLSPRGQPKRLGFSSSLSMSPPPPATPATLTPSSTPSPTSFVPPLSRNVASSESKMDESAAEAATPKQIRFAEPETREISPAYVSPDSLARPPLSSLSDEDSQHESSPTPAVAMSDEEITFNFSRQKAEPMDAESESDASTVPVATPSPTLQTASPAHRPSPSPLSPSRLSQSLTQSAEEDSRQAQSRLHPSKAPASPQASRPVRPQLSSRDESTEAQSGKYTRISPRERSPIAVQTVVANLSQSRSVRESLQVSPRTRSQSSGDQEVDVQTSVSTSMKRVSHVSREYMEEYVIRVVPGQTAPSASREPTLVLEQMAGQDLSPLIECEDGTEAPPAYSLEAMETIEPAEESLLLAARQASSAPKKIVEELESSDTVEVAADDDVPSLEIKPPTPIRRSSRSITPERSVKPTRTSRRATLRKDSASASTESREGTTEPTPPKLRRVSPGRTTKPSRDSGWSGEMPSLRLEASEDENSNDNRSAPSQRSSRRSVDRSPPVSPSRRSLRKSAERSPPPSPSRRSSRRSEERSATPERTGRASKSSTDKELVQTESSSDEMMPPPASPSRRPTRLRTPERTSTRKAKTPEHSTKMKDASVESSDSGVESSRMPDSTATTDTELPSAAAEEDVPKSPGRRSSQRSKTPATTRQGSSTASEPDADAEAAKSPSRRSTRRAMPGLDEKEAPKSPARRSTRHLGTPEVSATTQPASPSRRSGRRSKTPERTAVSPARQKRGAEKSGVGVPSVMASEGPAPPSSGGGGTPRKERTISADSASPSRRATRSEGSVFEELAESVPASPGRRSAHADRTPPGESVESAPASPGRRSARRDRTPSRDSVEPASARVSPGRQSSRASRERSASGDSAEAASAISPSRRLYRGRSGTPERSPARTSTRLRGKGSTSEDASALGVKDIAVVMEEVRSSRKQQKEVEAPPGAGAAVSKVAEETGDAPTFQFAPPTPLSGIQADSPPVPASDVSAFTFSIPLTHATRSQKTSTSSSASVADTPSQSARPRARSESEHAAEEEMPDAAEEEMPDVALEAAHSASEEASKTADGSKGKQTMKSSRKKAKSAPVLGASPTDSPINVVSPGEPSSSGTRVESGSRLPSRRSKTKRSTLTRVLRKRKAKLW